MKDDQKIILEKKIEEKNYYYRHWRSFGILFNKFIKKKINIYFEPILENFTH